MVLYLLIIVFVLLFAFIWFLPWRSSNLSSARDEEVKIEGANEDIAGKPRTLKVKGNNLIAHIAGPYGSGFERMGAELRELYGIQVVNMERFYEDVDKHIDSNLPNEEYDRAFAERFKKNVENYLKITKKPVIFIGFEDVNGYRLDLPTKNKFYIKKPVGQILYNLYMSNPNVYDARAIADSVDSIIFDLQMYERSGYTPIGSRAPLDELVIKSVLK